MPFHPQAVRLASVFGLMVAAGLAGHPAKAGNLVTNGSFTNTTAYEPGSTTVGTDINNSNLSGWNVTGCLAAGCSTSAPNQIFMFLATPSVGTSGVYAVIQQGAGIINFDGAPGAAPGGGNAITSDAGNQSAALYQTVSGLTVGDTYQLSFYQATLQATSGTQQAFNAAWNVYFGTGAATNAQTAATATSASMANSGSSYTSWTQQTIALTATAASETLSFFATASGGQPPFLLLDGVSLVDQGASAQTASVPEPASMALLGAGAIGMLLARRKRAA